MATCSSFLPGKSHRQRSLVGCSPRGHQESDTTERANSNECHVRELGTLLRLASGAAVRHSRAKAASTGYLP